MSDPGLVTPQVIQSDYVSNVATPWGAQVNGVAYGGNITIRTNIKNHSADLTMGYRSSPASSLIWSVRVRRDNNLAPDDTVFTFPDSYGSSPIAGSYTTSEGAYGDGYNVLPYDGAKYFYDIYNVRFSNGSTIVNAVGSAQSDRMTCYKTVSCKFK